MSLPPIELSSTIRAPRARDFYLAYLNSPEWRARRQRALRLANWHCQRCAAKRDLQVHHKTYERLGREWDQDLEVVCANCHEGEHITQTQRSPAGIYLKLLSTLLKATPFAAITELSDALKEACRTHRVDFDPAAAHRAIELVTGSRLTRRERVRYLTEIAPGPAPITKQDAHEILTRVRRKLELGDVIRAMPSGPGMTPEAQADHERRLQVQRRVFQRESYLTERRRQSLRERLEEIFSEAS